MKWLRQHSEAGNVRAVALVAVDSSGFGLQLTECEGTQQRSHDIGLHYSSRAMAFEAADTLIRHRLGGHMCGAGCSAWATDADVG